MAFNERRKRWRSQRSSRGFYMGSLASDVGGVSLRGLRIGYLNSQGLDANNWAQVQNRPARSIFDLVYIAETWYMRFAEYAGI